VHEEVKRKPTDTVEADEMNLVADYKDEEDEVRHIDISDQ